MTKELIEEMYKRNSQGLSFEEFESLWAGYVEWLDSNVNKEI